MKKYFFIFSMLTLVYDTSIFARAKRSFTINEFNMELDALAQKYGKIAIDDELREREKKFDMNRDPRLKKKVQSEEKKQAIQTSIERHSYIGKEVEIINLYFNEDESKTLRFRDNTAEGRVTVYYKSSQKKDVKNKILKNPTQKFAVTGKFIRIGKEGIELEYVSAKVLH